MKSKGHVYKAHRGVLLRPHTFLAGPCSLREFSHELKLLWIFVKLFQIT